MEDDIPKADPLIVGKWQNKENPLWYKVYYDDYDRKEKLFWGKEWNEAEDVMEEDLRYHKNGWFRWERKGRIIHEYATMDTRDVPIHKEYHFYKYKASRGTLIYYETDYRKIKYRFTKITD